MIFEGEDRIDVQFPDFGIVHQHLRDSLDHVGEGGQVHAGLPANAGQHPVSPKGFDHFVSLPRRDRGHFETDVFQHFHIYTPQPEHDHVPEARYGVGPDDDFVGPGQPGLYQEPGRGVGEPMGHLPGVPFERMTMRNVKDHTTVLGLVQHGFSVDLEHYGVADFLGGRETLVDRAGGLEFGDASMLDMSALHKEWYDWTLKEGDKPEFLKKRIAYYVAGAEEWKYAENLEEIATARQRLYLHSDGKANDVFHSGMMSEEKPGLSPADHYVYDPLDTRPAELESEEHKNSLADLLWGDSPLNQSYALNLFGNGLVYHSDPFTEATEISGYVKFVGWIAINVPDTDFMVTLYEIMPDGKSVFLTADLIRARYRESLRKEKLVTPGEVLQYEFNSFRFFSRRIAKGSRLRLVLSSPNSIHLQKNHNSGGVVAEETAEDARTAHITLYHDNEHPSFLEIPIVR